LWQEVPVFNRFANNNQGAEITNAPLSVTLTLTTEIAQARVFLPNNSIQPLATFIDPTSLALSVPDQLLVIELTPSVPLAGDFNNDGSLDAADYVTWRKGLGSSFTEAHYGIWRANFGRTAGNGLVTNPQLRIPIPEPPALFSALMLLAVALACHPPARV
jgi:hypothetical protein